MAYAMLACAIGFVTGCGDRDANPSSSESARENLEAIRTKVTEKWKTIENAEANRKPQFPDYPSRQRIGGFQIFESASELWIFLDLEVEQRRRLVSPPTIRYPLSVQNFIINSDGVKEKHTSPPTISAHPLSSVFFRFENCFFGYELPNRFLGRPAAFYLWKSGRLKQLTPDSSKRLTLELKLGDSFESLSVTECRNRLLDTSGQNGFKRIAAGGHFWKPGHETVSERHQIVIRIQSGDFGSELIVESIDPKNRWKETLLNFDANWKEYKP